MTDGAQGARKSGMARDFSSFMIPLALDGADALVHPADSEKGGTFLCPQCRSQITLRKGKVRRPHFAHPSNSECSSESVLHLTAKLLIVRVVEEWKAGGPVPTIVRCCVRCCGAYPQRLPDRVHAAVQERPVASGVIPDVLLLDSAGKGLAAIEIYHTHAVDEDKGNRMGMPWCELLAVHVVADPLRWFPVKDALKPFVHCLACIARDKEHAARYGANGYIERQLACYRCEGLMPVFEWRRNRYWLVKRPPDPVPPSLQFRSSTPSGRKYWVNVCPSCDAIQEDSFLKLGRDGPFWGHNDPDLEWEEEIRDYGVPPPVGWERRAVDHHLHGDDHAGTDEPESAGRAT